MDVSGCGWAGEYTTLDLTAGVNYIFTSSVATDWLTISNSAGTVGLVFGLGPQNYTPPTTTTYRFYTHTSSACGVVNACRTRFVQCGTPPLPPANNDCASATPLTVGANGSCPASATAGTTVAATGGAAPTPTCLIPGLLDVWYSFNSGANTSINYNIVQGTQSAFGGQVLTACGGTEVFCVANTLSGTFPVTASTNYLFRVLTLAANTGTFTVCLQGPPAPPANDACANAIAAPSLPFTSAVISNALATDDVPVTACSGPFKNIWWTVTPTLCGTVTVQTCPGSNFDTEVAVFSGACGSLVEIGCNDDGGPAACAANASSFSWAATAGVTYTISVGSYASFSGTGNIQLGITTNAIDTDGDGTGDDCDLCPSDPNKIAPGICGCGVADVPTTYFADNDGDGFGDASAPLAGFTCIIPPGHVADNTDCDDTQLLYTDADGDGFGAGAPVACGVADNTDCDDTQLLYTDADGDGFGAGAAVACGVADNTDCDDTQLLYADADGDGFGAGAPVACGVADNTDCDDTQLLYTDADGDGFGAGAPVACGVADNTDCDDTQLLYADADGDGYGAGAPVACGVNNNIDDCPSLFGLQGDFCDVDPSPTNFVLGQIDGTCTCLATPSDFNVVLEHRTPDGSSDEISWEIELVSSNLVICSGGGFANNITSPIVVTCGLVDNECYILRVFDSAGDGFGTNGGYQLRQTGSPNTDIRIIDNLGNFTTGATSAIGGGPNSFCFPMSTQKPIFVSREKLDWINNQYLVAEPDAAVSEEWIENAPNNLQSSTTGYQFWFFDPNGSFSFRRGRTHSTSDNFGPANEFRACHMRINNWPVANQIPDNVLMNVRIRTRVNGVYGDFGPAYRFMMDAQRALCPLTKLNDIPDQQYESCNKVRNWGTGNWVHARPVSGANRYQFRFRIPAENFVVAITSNTYFLQLNWTNNPLEAGKTYLVDVRASKDNGATWCSNFIAPALNPWGDLCNLTIGNDAQDGEQNLGLNNGNSGSLAMWPNPNRGDQLWIDLSGIEAGVEAVAVEIFDMTGKQIVTREIPTQGDRLNTVLNLNGDLATGLYLVNITAGEKRYTERLVIAN